MSDDPLIARLNAHHPKLIDLSLERVETLLARLGNPEKALPSVVHVAGTNGKGSVLAFIRAMAEAAGLKCHVYTSPHLVAFNERIVTGGHTVTNDELTALLDECEEALGDDPITFFEITTAMAYLAFSRAQADLTLIETGLGGRLDATNLFEAPAVTALTAISLDHQQHLGPDVKGIAAEKAAIMRKDVPCVAAAQEDAEVTQVIADTAAATGAKLLAEGKDWSVRRESGRVVVQTPEKLREIPMPVLAGDHQIVNAAQAITCIDQLSGFTIPDAAIVKGLSTVRWPARLQRLARGPLVQELPPAWEVWVDGGHNPSAGRALAKQAEKWTDKPLGLIVGMLNTKDPEAFLEPLAQHVQYLVGVRIPGEEASLEAEDVVAIARALGIEARESGGLNLAIQRLQLKFDRPARVLVCGSLYLAGEVLKANS